MTEMIRLIKLVKAECHSKVSTLQSEMEEDRLRARNVTLELNALLTLAMEAQDKDTHTMTECLAKVGTLESILSSFSARLVEVELNLKNCNFNSIEENITLQVEELIANSVNKLETRLILLEEEMETEKLSTLHINNTRDERERVRETKFSHELTNQLEIISATNKELQATNNELIYVSQLVAEKVC